MEAPALPGPSVLLGGYGFDVDGAEDVVGEDRKGHLGSGRPEVSGEESSASHHSLDGAERMLGGAAPSSHHLRRGARVHAVERILVQMSGDVTARAVVHCGFRAQPEQALEP